MSLFVIGDANTVLGFRLAGIDGRIASSAYEAREGLEVAASNSKINIVIITEQLAELIRRDVNKYIYETEYPLIIEIPDAAGPSETRKTIQQILKETIGVSV